ncbi:hypothetical protein NIES4075_67740 [Tolypothrix sp. NIES-4075]|uniref:hypothetical protein n=1 Tax=Tolypothrix sp. NIES-4075 TaxID=2005459 RepID=UPI000B5CA5F7|nr:hypothetical protein [Tolypothrix sp. NIES-4075]GAX45753.1 hypothetical protein NIES4075_67740 [Tolypothrix sp. NIES-4075]
MTRVRRKRVSLSLRLQPYEGDPMAEVVDYLNSLPKDEVNRKVADILVAALLPIARYKCGNYTPEQLRFACWESQDSLNKHGSNMRLAMGVEQPQFVLPNNVTPLESVTVNAKTIAYNGKTTPESDTNHSDQEPQRPTSMVQGKASSQDLDSIFGDG